MDIITPYVINNKIKNKTIDIDLNTKEKEELFKIIVSKLKIINFNFYFQLAYYLWLSFK